MGQMQDVVKPVHLAAGLLERPKLGCQRARGRFEQCRQRQMIGAETHPHGTECCAIGLLQTFHIVGHFGAVEYAECFGNLEGDTPGNACQAFCGFQNLQGAEQFGNMGFQPVLQAQFDLFTAAACQMLVSQQADLRFKNLFSGRNAGNDLAEPTD